MNTDHINYTVERTISLLNDYLPKKWNENKKEIIAKEITFKISLEDLKIEWETIVDRFDKFSDEIMNYFTIYGSTSSTDYCYIDYHNISRELVFAYEGSYFNSRLFSLFFILKYPGKEFYPVIYQEEDLSNDGYDTEIYFERLSEIAPPYPAESFEEARAIVDSFKNS